MKQTLVEMGISIALAVALSYLKFFTMPQGALLLTDGSDRNFGGSSGHYTGISRWVNIRSNSYVIKPKFFHPLQGLLDYPVAFLLLDLLESG